MNGEEILEQGLLETHQEIMPNAMFDPTILVGIITGIMALIQGCKESSASRQMKRGGAISKRAIRQVLEKENYQGDVRQAAKKLAEKGRNLTEEDIKAVIDDAKDVPDNSGWWPTAVTGAIILALFLPTTANANWWPTGDQMAVVDNSQMWPTKPKPMETRIILEISDNCGPCEYVVNKKLPVLEAAGWSIGEGPENHIQVVNVTGTDHGPTPTWNLIHHGKEFAELVGSDHTTEFVGEWYNTFMECGTVLKPTAEEREKAKPRTLSAGGVPSGGSWVYYGSGSLSGHLVRVHGYAWSDVSGLSHGQLVYLHSYAHNHGRPYRAAKKTQIARARPYCPTCPR